MLLERCRNVGAVQVRTVRTTILQQSMWYNMERWRGFPPWCDEDGSDAVPKGAHGLNRIEGAGAAVPHPHSLIVAPADDQVISWAVR